MRRKSSASHTLIHAISDRNATISETIKKRAYLERILDSLLKIKLHRIVIMPDDLALSVSQQLYEDGRQIEKEEMRMKNNWVILLQQGTNVPHDVPLTWNEPVPYTFFIQVLQPIPAPRIIRKYTEHSDFKIIRAVAI